MEYLLTRISILMNVGIFQVDGEKIKSYQEHSELNPIACSEELRAKLIHEATEQKLPYIYKDEYSANRKRRITSVLSKLWDSRDSGKKAGTFFICGSIGYC